MTSAYIFAQVGSGGGSGMEVHKALHAIPGVKTVHFVAGPIDLILFVEAADQAGLTAIVQKMRAVPGVAGTDTRIVFAM
jgi:DNA-binding Lrp family transcriptional regulator